MIVVAMTFSIAFSMIFVSCGTIGNGNLVASERVVSPFNKINGKDIVKVNYHTSSEYRVTVTTDSNLTEFVTTDVKDNVLNIEIKNGHYKFTKILVDIYCPTLTDIEISDSGDFNGIDRIITSTLKLNVSDSGNIMVTIECDNFLSQISGSGKIIVSGNSTDSNISISGSGNLDGNNFIVNNAIFNISGSGNAYISVTDYLQADISGSGTLNYNGEPKIDYYISGSGKIKKI
jgi:hypothetical protein